MSFVRLRSLHSPVECGRIALCRCFRGVEVHRDAMLKQNRADLLEDAE